MKNSNDTVDRERRSSLLWILFSFTFLSAFPLNSKAQAATRLGPRRLLKRALEDIIRNRPAAEQIGSIYLAAHPDEEDFDRLAGDLIDSSFEGDSEILRQRISAQRVRDFANEDVTIVDGWVLARVEARVCALMHIL